MKISALRTLVLATVLATSAVSANATATFETGSSSALTLDTFSDFKSSGLTSGVRFDDKLKFTVANPGDLFADVTGRVNSNSTNASFTFSLFELLSSSFSVLATGTIDAIGTTGKISTGYLNSSYSAGPGTYFLHIVGTGFGTPIKYNGTVSLATPVPEPETYGMFLAGLGLMGFVASRRKFN